MYLCLFIIHIEHTHITYIFNKQRPILKGQGYNLGILSTYIFGCPLYALVTETVKPFGLKEPLHTSSVCAMCLLFRVGL